MPRQHRYIAPGVATHVTQRGNNKGRCFFCAEDFEFYLAVLERSSRRFGCAIHAYVLMSNHSHLLVTPEDAQGISQMMQMIGRCYVRYLNTRYHRTGTLWEGRFRSSVVAFDPYLLTCYRYIELNPVRAGLAHAPDRYMWSSHHHNAAGASDSIITPHPLYEKLGANARDRQAAYRALFRNYIEERTLDVIRRSARRGAVLVDSRSTERVDVDGNSTRLLPSGSSVTPVPI